MSQPKLRSLLCIASVLLASAAALAQTQQSAPTTPPAQGAPPAQQISDQQLTAAQLDSLVSPIALYPDTLLSQVLIASTYPLEVIEADRWLKGNKGLKGDALKSAVEQQKWDDSIKALTATPSVVEMMATQLSWMQRLGDAMLAQQPDVMDAVQRLRSRAEANGKLTTTKQQKVSSQTQSGGKRVIVIEPAQPDAIYVPYYDPAVVYGDWAYPDYPPYYWPAPGYIGAGILATGLAFGAGYALGRWASGNFWGNTINWNNNNINIDRGNRNWVHNPIHRQGIRYSNRDVANRFGGNRAGVADRADFRGRGGQQVLRPSAGAGARPGGGAERASTRPSGGRGEAGNRPGGGRGEAGNRPAGGRGQAGNRPSGGRGQASTRPSGGRGQASNRPRPQQRPSGGARVNALGSIGPAGAARAQAMRGRASMGGAGPRFAGGGGRSFGGGGGFRGGGGGGFRGGGGRRSDLRLKHDVVFLGQLDNGLGFYRFIYDGGTEPYVGVMAQEAQSLAPQAVVRGKDGFLRVRYDLLGIKLQRYDAWVASGAQLPRPTALTH